ncbi:MAG TPA: hypothetical protein VIX20_08675 [Ktedonobacteraceae bacterium]
MTVWVIRVWEEQARDAEEPLEWIVVTSVPTTTLGQAPATMTISSDLGWRSRVWVAIWLAPMMVPPFWRTIWKGWLSLQTFLEGVHFAFHLTL